MAEITQDIVNNFLMGSDPMEKIVSIECDYNDEKVSIIYNNDEGEKMVKICPFKPFVWVKHSAAIRMFNGDRTNLRKKLSIYGISVKKLRSEDDKGYEHPRLADGYKYLFYANRQMSFAKFMRFFQEAGTPIYPRKKKNETVSNAPKELLTCSPVEQYMISSGRRMFKGYNNYDDLKRMSWDIETQGLNPEIHRVEQIGIRTNKGFRKVIAIEGNSEEELNKNELNGIEEAIKIFAEEKPDTLFGHNSEVFDWNFFIVRLQKLGTSIEEVSSKYFRHPIFKRQKEQVLKLGGEMEYYKPTIAWGYNILDSLHAVRRAQALDSSMKSANLKYVTKYLSLKKPNRVYVPGNQITDIWNENRPIFAFNDNDGDWYRITEERPIQPNYEAKNGRYIVERYLLDDIWETEKVELTLNESNFLVGKMLPTTFSRACTMGTATIWKLIMMAWCYENNLAMPTTAPNHKFTGGLSRLLKTGYVDRIVKLDYNSLYPSIILTWNIGASFDITKIMLHLLEYILTQREYHKGLKAKFGKIANEKKDWLKEHESELSKEEIAKVKREIDEAKSTKMSEDKNQLPLKILGNSFFGSYGCPSVFPFGTIESAEKTTCIGRMCLRLMISHFTNLGYMPIVGDSFTEDTPVFVKYNDDYHIANKRGLIDIVPVSDLFDEIFNKTDLYGREYSTNTLIDYKVLCRSGWVEPSYIYRHNTEKDIYCVSDDDKSLVEVTEDHSLYNADKEKIKPNEINENTKLEYYNGEIKGDAQTDCDNTYLKLIANSINEFKLTKIPVRILNLSTSKKIEFLELIKPISKFTLNNSTKTLVAGIRYLERCVNGEEINSRRV